MDETGGNLKTLQSDYKDFGRFPIIDQGKEFIAGYTNDAACLCKAKPPVVIFGDHTRAFKFVEFPFCLGADGTKVLRSSSDVDPKYLYHFLRQVPLESAGYSRHFKFLKDVMVPLPPLDEQRRIAAILDQADALRRKRRETKLKLEHLVDALFEARFGNPKKEPNRWPTLNFDKACGDETAKSEKLQRGEYLSSGNYPVVDQGQSRVAGWSNDERLLCVSRGPVVVFGDHTRAVKYVDFPFIIGADGAKVLKPTNSFHPLFFAHLLRRLPLPDLGYSRHMREAKRLQFPCPPRELQNRFAVSTEAISRAERQVEEHKSKLDTLFASLQHRAFNGEL